MKKIAKIIAGFFIFAIIIFLLSRPARVFLRDFFYAFSVQSSTSEQTRNEIQSSELQAISLKINALERENYELREICKIANVRNFKIIIAEIISRDPRTWKERMIVNKGLSDGVEHGMLVLCVTVSSKAFKGKFSVLGRVREVSKQTAEIATIYHRDFSLSVMFGEDKIPAILVGGIEPHLEHFNFNLLKKGELDVISSEFSTICPPYIPVGSIIVENVPGVFGALSSIPFISWADAKDARFVIILANEK